MRATPRRANRRRQQRPSTLRRALAPLGAYLALALLAGFLIGRDVLADDAHAGVAPSTTVAVQQATQQAAQQAISTAGGADLSRAGALAGSATGPARYTFLLLEPDRTTPIRWNPCAPIHYKVSLGRVVPASEVIQVRAAFDTVGEALGGVTFVYDGTTDVVPDVIDGSAAADTDIVFAFATHGSGPDGSDLLSGWEAGRGGLAAAGSAGADGVTRQRPTHGSVVLDVDVWKVISRHDRAVLYLHEIGHAVGLDHPRDDRQIMSSGAYDLPVRYQSGDLAGLARLGRQAGCAP
jgi:hypothetical protein